MTQRTKQRVNELRLRVDERAQALEPLLEVYGQRVDREQARFLRGYLYSLTLDFELTMTRGEAERLELIAEDLDELFGTTCGRLEGFGEP